MPTRRASSRLLLGAVAAVLLLAPSPASAGDLHAASWEGGEVLISVNDQFTEATIQKLVYTFNGCGTRPAESSCNWEVKAELGSDPATRCNPSTPASQVVFSSGPQAGNGAYSAAPQSFPLEGCRGQVLTFWHSVEKTYEAPPGGEPPPVVSSGGSSSFLTFRLGFHPIQEMEEAIVRANPAPALPPLPIPPALSISANCRVLTIGATRYAFSFRQMGCRKASNLARMRYVSGAAPSGYACKRRGGGTRCWRQGKPRRYVQWTLPR